ncbi:hypothetical protein BKA62DRAFT_687223 [Auriculariales sp. MPI-PUGE-AT-0066]|nr:hypothetical protein BKA62DRAFT_687223 [Auriculariales sp. MPI-PUGE-AT-0066]
MFPATALLVVALCAGVAFAQDDSTDAAVCNPGGTSAWLNNDVGDDPCSIWADLARVCTPTVTSINGLSQGQHYGSPSGNESTTCMCNTVAYNLMAGCTYCQSVPGSTWVDKLTWETNCTAYTDLPPLTARAIDYPKWALLDVTTTWSAEAAEQIGNGDEPSSTAAPSSSTSRPVTSARPTSGTSSRHVSSQASGGDYDGWDNVASNVNWGLIGAMIAIFVGLPLIGMIAALVVCCVRQKRRKAWYGPLAAYYAGGGLPPYGVGGGSKFVPDSGPVTPSVAPVQSMYGAAPGYSQPAYSQQPLPQAGYLNEQPQASYLSQQPQAGYQQPTGYPTQQPYAPQSSANGYPVADNRASYSTYSAYEPTAMAPSTPGSPPPQSITSASPMQASFGAPTMGQATGTREVTTIATPPAGYAAYSQQAYGSH